MSTGSGGFFGGGTKETEQTTVSTTEAREQNVQVGGSAGTLVAPEAQVTAAGGASAKTAPFSNIVQVTSTNTTGVQAADVQVMLDSVFRDSQASRESMAGLGESLSSGIQEQSSALVEALAATRAPEQTALGSLVPVVIVALVVFLVWRR
ncbi:MAG: hypothetical protein EHM35_13030 [Planctomycetaceae bacterium]|nr:MAG: hypothetical protein EHM35_13030 [Planctomycetaceae bacterium]